MSDETSRSGYADVGGTCMYYEIAGEGEPVVLVHAGIANNRMWDEQVADLSRDFLVVRYDMRGFGKTAPVEGPFWHHRDLAELVDRLGIGPAAFVGSSIGGRTVIDLALEFPEKVRALVAVAPGVSGFEADVPDPPEWQEVIAAYERGDLEQASEYEVRIWVDGPSRGPDVVPASIRDRVREWNMIPLAVPDELYDQQTMDPPAAGRLQRITAPMLVIEGELDQPSEHEQGAHIAAHVPQAEIVTMQAAHLPNMERPKEFNDLVRSFLRRSFSSSGSR